MGGALTARPASRLRLKRPKIDQQRPTTQPRLRRLKVSMQGPAGVQQSIQGIHRAVHLSARAMARRVTLTRDILLGPTPGLLQRLRNRTRPAPRRAPLTERLHRRTERGGIRRPVHLPDLAVQLERLAAAVADLQESMQEAEDQ